MATYRIPFKSPQRAGTRLIDFLNDSLPEEFARRGIPALSRSKIRRLIIAGAVSENGRPLRLPAAILGLNSALSVVIDTDRAFFEREPEDIAFELTKDRILYEDDAIIVVNKPAGIPVEATIVASRDHLHAAVKRYLHRATESRNEPYAGLLHRLDRETSGVIVLTKRRDANAALHAQFLEHLIRKEYLALAARPSDNIKGRPRALPRAGDELRVENRLARITSKSAAGKWGEVPSGGDEAITTFEIERVCPAYFSIKAWPLTGRTHQIRVHLAGLGYPILGDSLYGGPDRVAINSALTAPVSVSRVMLHAKTITFRHPLDGSDLTVSAPIPEDFLPFLA